MAELAINVHSYAPDPAYQDGDILVAMNNKRVKSTHVQMLTHQKHMTRSGDGLLPENCLHDHWCKRMHQYKFQRVSKWEIDRITLATMDSERLSNIPNAKGERIHVPQYVGRRMNHPRNRMFGTVGLEWWYGGRTTVTDALLDEMWDEIEVQTIHRRNQDFYTKWPFTTREKQVFLILATNDFSDIEKEEMVEPETITVNEGTEDEHEEIVKKRKRRVDWRNLLGTLGVSEGQVLNEKTALDVRGTVRLNPSLIVTQKQTVILPG
jgi:hypothetical protein